MKILLFLITASIIISDGNAQTLIGESLNPIATANHNQRKTIRDSANNIYVVYSDSLDGESIIKGVKYESFMGTWDEATLLFPGKNPTQAISQEQDIHLIYESNDSVTRIMHTSSIDFINWTKPVCISDTAITSILPVADVDSTGKLNILWIGKNSIAENFLVYSYIKNDLVQPAVHVITKKEINDVAIANQLQYGNDDLLAGIQYNGDSLLFIRSNKAFESFDILYQAQGYRPCISYNYRWHPSIPEENQARFLYIDKSDALIEVEYNFPWNNVESSQLPVGTVDLICIDDLAPPIGYSYLFMKDESLYHGFSYGSSFWGWNSILDTISCNPLNPSIAYKSFNFYQIDYLWMEEEGSIYNIYHKRDPKHIWLGLNDPEEDKGFLISGFPNPFSDKLTIKIGTNAANPPPEVRVYNFNSQLINILEPKSSNPTEYEYIWSGLNSGGVTVEAGIYIITCSIGNKRTARKILFNGR